MGVALEHFSQGDVYIDYAFEDVMFRYENSTRLFYRKFDGETEEREVPFDNRLLNDAERFGDECDAATYHKGRPTT